jgi:hypothetical protein
MCLLRVVCLQIYSRRRHVDTQALCNALRWPSGHPHMMSNTCMYEHYKFVFCSHPSLNLCHHCRTHLQLDWLPQASCSASGRSDHCSVHTWLFLMFVRVHSFMYARTKACMRVHTHTYVHAYIHVHICTYTYTHTQIQTYLRKCIHTCTYIPTQNMHASTSRPILRRCIVHCISITHHVCIHVIHTYIHKHTHTT